MDSQKRDYTAKVILALLVSGKDGLTLKRLDDEYLEQEGERIPFKDFGYVSLGHYLKSMPKIVRLDQVGSNIIVRGIASIKSKHVSTLVAGQKSQVKRKIIGNRFHRPSPPLRSSSSQFRVSLSANIITKIVNLINKHPNGLNKDFVYQIVETLQPYGHITMNDMEKQLQNLQHKIFQKDNKYYPVYNKVEMYDEAENTWDFCINDRQKNVKSTTNSDEPSTEIIITASGTEDSNDMTEPLLDDDDFEFVPTSFIQHPASMKTYVKPKPTSSFIRDSVNNCQVNTEPNELNQNNAHYETHDDTEYQDNETQEDYYNFEISDLLINDRIKFRLEKLIQKYPEGIWCADLPSKYLEEYKVSLNYIELGYNSVREFASHLPKIFHLIQPLDTGDFMLFNAKAELPPKNKKEKPVKILSHLSELYDVYLQEDEVEPLPTTVSLETCKRLIPNEVVAIDESVGHLSVRDLASGINPYIEVLVVEVFNPSFFWIQLRKKQKVFEKMMKELHQFYVTNAHKYLIPSVVLEKGLHCACTYDNYWHRGIIKTVRPDLQVTVWFFDFGTLKTYPSTSIYYLHRSFSHLPAQAIPCGLLNTRPRHGNKWSRTATQQFTVKTWKKPLVATVGTIREEDNSMFITLTDTLEEEDVHLNDWLVEHKLAVHGKLGDHVDMSSMMLYIEDNLTFLTDEEETDYPDNKTNSSEDAIDVPLVTPQSTLVGTSLNPPAGFTHRPDPANLGTIIEEHQQGILNGQLDENGMPLFNGNNTSTNPMNPFAPRNSTCNENYNFNMESKSIVQLWNENLRLQMQIASIINTLIKVINFPKSDTTDENTLNQEKIVSPTTESNGIYSSNHAEVIPEEKITNDKFYQMTVDAEGSSNFPDNLVHNGLSPAYPNEKDFDVHQRLGTDRHESFASSNDKLQNTKNQIVRNNCNTNPFLDEYYNYDSKANINYEDYYSNETFAANNNVNDFKESNPFRRSALQILRSLPNSGEEISSSDPDPVTSSSKSPESNIIYDSCSSDLDRQKSIRDANKISHVEAENYYSCDETQSENNYVGNNKGHRNNVCSLYTWNSDDITKKFPKIITDNSFTNKNDQVEGTTTENYVENLDFPSNPFKYAKRPLSSHEFSITAKKETRSNSTHVPVFDPKNIKKPPKVRENTPEIDFFNDNSSLFAKLFSSDRETNHNGSADQNEILDLLLSNWSAINPAYPTRPSASNTLRSTQASNEVEETNTTKNSIEFQSHDASTAVIPDDLPLKGSYSCCSKKYVPMDSRCSKKVKQQDEALAALDKKESNIWRNSKKKRHTYYRTIELPKREIKIFHYKDEGWLLTEEFTKEFIGTVTVAYMMNLLEILNISVQFEELDRDHVVLEFSEWDGSLPIRGVEYVSKKTHLIQLKSILKMLNKLGIITRKDIDRALIKRDFDHGSITHEIVMIIRAYGEFKSDIEQLNYDWAKYYENNYH